jgi:hypothetical protein
LRRPRGVPAAPCGGLDHTSGGLFGSSPKSVLIQISAIRPQHLLQQRTGEQRREQKIIDPEVRPLPRRRTVLRFRNGTHYKTECVYRWTTYSVGRSMVMTDSTVAIVAAHRTTVFHFGARFVVELLSWSTPPTRARPRSARRATRSRRRVYPPCGHARQSTCWLRSAAASDVLGGAASMQLHSLHGCAHHCRLWVCHSLRALKSCVPRLGLHQASRTVAWYVTGHV